MRGQRWKRTAIVVGGLVAAALLLLIALQALLFYAMFVRNPFDDEPFDRDIWLRARTPTSGPDPRGPMAEDLCERFLGPGTSRMAVHALLGEPDRSWDDEEKLQVDFYNLGHWSLLKMEPDYLQIHYDQEDEIAWTAIPKQ
jgi:hypothetical protein